MSAVPITIRIMKSSVFPLLRLLSDGEFHSGEVLAAQFGLSRGAVWYQVRRAEQVGLKVFKVRGRGYRLSRPSGELRIADIILAVDEPISTTRCKTGGTKGCTKTGARCVTHDLWEELGQQIHVFLSSVSLADVVERRVLGRSKPCNDSEIADVVAAE